jgi:hypothetical protein
MTENADSRLHWLRVLGAIALTALGALWPTTTCADEMPRVRSSSALIRGAIDDAVAWSPTFRRLVTAIGATDGIVYVEPGVCGHGVRACLNFSVTRAAGFRFLRVVVDLRNASTSNGRLDLIGTIGHELWHALEVLADRTLDTTEAIFQFYAREAPTIRNSFETTAAVAIGGRVRREAGGGVSLVAGECVRPQGVIRLDRWWIVPCV